MSEPLERCPVCQERWKSARAQTCSHCRKQNAFFDTPAGRTAIEKGAAARRKPRTPHAAAPVECQGCHVKYGGQAPGVCTTCGAALPGGRAA